MIPIYWAFITFFVGVVCGVIIMCFANVASDKKEIKDNWEWDGSDYDSGQRS